jgi:hypothetical protein
MRKGGLGVSVEQTVRYPDQSTYRPDFTLVAGIPGYTANITHCDLTVSCPFNKTVVKMAAKRDLVTAHRAEQRKNDEQKDELEALQYDFLPLAFESTGGHCEKVEVLVKYIAERKAVLTGIPFNEVFDLLWHEISHTLQKANANAIHSRFMQTLPVEGDD